MTTVEAQMLIDRFWASQYGCEPADLRREGTLVVQRAPIQSPASVAYVLRRHELCLVSVPATHFREAHAALAGLPPDQAFRAETLVAALGGGAKRVIGPAYHGHADAQDFRPVAASTGASVRELETADAQALDTLRQSCVASEWEDSGIDGAFETRFGCFAGEALVAVAKLQHLGENISWTGVVTHPSHRSRGFGAAVVSAATERGLALGRIMHYQTLVANVAAVRIAQSLGYRRYGQRLAIRLAE